ncbi:hypothetical protein [Photobacterium minamisatsumaniensis]|uniref:hypothetical protein n=1 Tax=Photobacterium minamisatsumaniensis TaxID=2910233 RepID=UPI003D09A404
MKKLTILIAAALLSISFNSMAFTLAGTPTVVEKDTYRYCAGATNFWVCVQSYELRKKK